jgi:hypothetical protein
MSVTISANVGTVTKTTATNVYSVCASHSCVSTSNNGTASTATAHVEATTASTANY